MSAAQRAASNPAVSAFVAASAGSGKTKLLTDRLLRLMLAGAPPERILCLTYTKAGAAEMALQLQKRLAAWVTAPDDTLAAELLALDLPPGAPLRATARELFARVLDLPGGVRISTIHAFCQSLLRRFPLEAAISPHFQLMDDAEARVAQRQARERLIAAPGEDAAVRLLAAEVSLGDFAGLIDGLQARRDRLDAALALGPARLQAAQFAMLGTRFTSHAEVIADAVAELRMATLRPVFQVIAASGSDALKRDAAEVLVWLSSPPDRQAENWRVWSSYFLTGKGKPREPKSLVADRLNKTRPDLRPILLAEQERIYEVEQNCRAVRVGQLSGALLRLAAPIVRGYAATKENADWLDYADLISRTNALLREPGAAWVLYKLDGGLDHLLLDEVQDTAPDQWTIADALTAEFFAGAGARETALPRTIFAVGDRKQSIFSFQGADPAGFDRWRSVMAGRALPGQWCDAALDVSFRSTEPVLALVDAVFADGPARAGVIEAGALCHSAHRAGEAGRVSLWPLVPRPAPPPEPDATPSAAYHRQNSAPRQLAEALAEYIAARISRGETLPSRNRPIHAGDFLVLVRTRRTIDQPLLHALKARGVPVAGLDRMALTLQPAVADLLALCDAVLLPQDDLCLACVLTSPLGGLSDDSLMQLAMGRRGTLWDTLRARAAERADWQAAQRMLAVVFARVDYVTPHALLAEVLGPLGGRARLFARLGPQAAEPIDELLSTALLYGQRHAPSLQGFVQWLRQSGAEVKREPHSAAAELRIMTVHGAKGLQAPVVILPDTVGLPPDGGGLVWASDRAAGCEIPIWAQREDLHTASFIRAKAEARAAERAEYHRQLYVALTRAEDEVVVCGWQTKKPTPPDCWYRFVQDGFARLTGACTDRFAAVADPWAGDVRWLACEPAGAVMTKKSAPPPDVAVLPGWMGGAPGWRAAPLPAEPAVPQNLAPSRPADASLGPVPHAASPLAQRDAAGGRFQRGQWLHSLLQHLPGLPAEARAAAAAKYLSGPGIGLTGADAAAVGAEAMAILNDPELAPLFGPGSRAEAPLTGVIDTPGGQRVVGGLIDRIAVLADRILIADYKTNRDPPATPAETPARYLAQLAAYRAVLRQIFPGRPVHCALIWTRAGRADWLDPALLEFAPNPMAATPKALDPAPKMPIS